MAVSVGVFQNQNTIAFAPTTVIPPIVHDLTDPDSPAVVNVDIRRVQHHRLGREQTDFQFGMDVQMIDCGIGSARRRPGGSRDRRRFLREDGEPYARGVAALIRPSVVKSSASTEMGVTFGQRVFDDRMRMRANSVGDGATVDTQRSSIRVLVDLDAAPIGNGRLPFQVGQLQFALRSHQTGFDPVGPVAAEPVTPVFDDKEQRAGFAERNIHFHGSAGRIAVDQRTSIDGTHVGRSEARFSYFFFSLAWSSGLGKSWFASSSVRVGVGPPIPCSGTSPFAVQTIALSTSLRKLSSPQFQWKCPPVNPKPRPPSSRSAAHATCWI